MILCRCGRCIEREQQIESRNTYFSCCDLEDQVPANYSRSGLFDIESLDESTCLIKNQKRTLDTEGETHWLKNVTTICTVIVFLN